jgi:hypothetical protein
MILPPLFIYFRIVDNGKKIIGLWFPMVLIWLILLPFVIIAFIVTLIGDIITFFQYRMTLILGSVLSLTTKLHGTTVNINNPISNSQIIIDIH